MERSEKEFEVRGRGGGETSVPRHPAVEGNAGDKKKKKKKKKLKKKKKKKKKNHKLYLVHGLVKTNYLFFCNI